MCLLQLYSCYDVLLDDTSIGEYLLSQEVKVGDEAISIPTDEVARLSEWHSDHPTLLSMLNLDGSDSE